MIPFTAIVTRSGIIFDFADPTPEMISIVDIAHALSQACRYAGHTPKFYSVAQHSVLVSRYVPPTEALSGLLHDAAEAYLCDLPGPLKHMDVMAGYRAMEERVQRAIASRFGVPVHKTILVRHAEDRVYAAELRDVAPEPLPWRLRHTSAQPIEERIDPLPPRLAYFRFMDRWLELIS